MSTTDKQKTNAKTITKVAKIEIKKPVNMDKSLFYSKLRDLQYQCFRMANKAISMLWDYQQFDFAYKERFGQYYLQEFKELPNGYKKVDSDILNEIKEDLSLMNSNTKDAMIRMITAKWSNDLMDVLKGNKSIPNFKRNIPIELHNKQFLNSNKEVRINKENGKYYLDLALFSRNLDKELGLKNGNVQLELVVKKAYLTPIVERIMSKEYKLCMSKLKYDTDNKKWFLLLTYSFEAQEKELDSNRIMGIDLGVNIPAVCAIESMKTYTMIGSRQEIERFEKETMKKRGELQASCKWASGAAVGRGRKRRTKRLEKIQHQISNYKQTKNHSFSRAIINFALQNKCGVIQLEDLSGISANNKMLKNWTYFDLQEKIQNKAKEVGIKVNKVSPSYTSQRCSRCGYVHNNVAKEVYRPTQEEFQCQNCGFKKNADVNAALNLSIKDIDKVIEAQVKAQQKFLQHALEYDV